MAADRLYRERIDWEALARRLGLLDEAGKATIWDDLVGRSGTR